MSLAEPYYADESVTLYHGDCRESTAWLEADVLVTDPPYGMRYQSNARIARPRHAPISGDGSTEIRDAALAMWADKPGLVFGTWRVAKPAGVRLTLTWDKGPSVGSGDIGLPWGLSTEDVYLIGAWPPIEPGGRRREGGTPARSSSVLRVDNYNTQSTARPNHPTPKPLALMVQLIAKTTGVVADPFAGSGATLVAAKQLRRKAIGVELEERYCEVIAKRLAQGVLDFGEPA